jgi:bifunctional DNA-binding transcriptional regulator/antitoxin component of YhaV-PrlF toxin-antitoxin module
MIKIKTYTVSRKGIRGLTICLPAVWTSDLKIKKGDILDLYRDKNDRLIIIPPIREALSTGRTQ